MNLLVPIVCIERVENGPLVGRERVMVSWRENDSTNGVKNEFIRNSRKIGLEKPTHDSHVLECRIRVDESQVVSNTISSIHYEVNVLPC